MEQLRQGLDNVAARLEALVAGADRGGPRDEYNHGAGKAHLVAVRRLPRQARHLDGASWLPSILPLLCFDGRRCLPGAEGFSYHKPIFTIMIVFDVVSVVELVVADRIVSRWTYIRIPLLILSIWGLVWMLGFLFGMLARPHSVGPDGIRVRYGSEVDIPIPLERRLFRHPPQASHSGQTTQSDHRRQRRSRVAHAHPKRDQHRGSARAAQFG